MKATPETRQRMLWALTAILSPMAFWMVFGLYEKLALAQSDPLGQSSRWSPSAEEQRKTQQLHDSLMKEALQGNWKQVAQIADDTCGKECPGLIFPLQAEAYWQLGNRELAAQLWRPALPAFGPVGQAESLAIRGDRKGYTEYINKLLALKEETKANPNDAAWATLLLPDALADYTPVIALAQQGVQSSPENAWNTRANALNTLGVALYRAGRWKDAILTLTESDRLAPHMINAAFLALCHHKLGQSAKARAFADRYENALQRTLTDTLSLQPEFSLFAQELRVVLPPTKNKKATTQ
jgi:tetratricopeptide (TPR) repeat protein